MKYTGMSIRHMGCDDGQVQMLHKFLGRCPAPRSAAGINLPTSLRSHFISGHPAAVRLLGLAGWGSIAFLEFQISVSGLCPSKQV